MGTKAIRTKKNHGFESGSPVVVCNDYRDVQLRKYNLQAKKITRIHSDFSLNTHLFVRSVFKVTVSNILVPRSKAVQQ